MTLRHNPAPTGQEACLEETVLSRADYCGVAAGGAGRAGRDVCRKVGISEQSFYRWKKVYGSLQPSEARELKQLRDEVTKLKRLVRTPACATASSRWPIGTGGTAPA